jgi:hypothetical protein
MAQEGPKTRLTADVRDDLHRKLKTAAAVRDIPVRDYLEHLLEAAFDADPYVRAVEAARDGEASRRASLREQIEPQLKAAAQIEDEGIRELVVERIRHALDDPLADVARAVGAFAAMSATDARVEAAASDVSH